ncbi:glycosyltransferase family 4 protein [Prosthecobacter sp.]|uniref:glycosyltransferase family 4 protein n=1 Tax=Prosthecobacter sp. TaxID=1965333 RepID=UPI003783CA71
MSLSSFPHWRIVHSEASLGWGGQEHRVMAELLGFQRRGSSVRLVAHPDSQIMARARAAGLNTRPCTFDRRLLPFEILRMALWLRREKIEIVNTHSSRDGWLLGLAARLARVPMVLRTRHIDVVDRSPKISRHKFTTLADHTLTTSDKITRDIRSRYQLAASKVSTVPTGIDLDLFHQTGPTAELPVRSGPGAPPVIGMVSVLRSWKGHSTFFAAIQLLREAGREFQYVVVGGGAPVEVYAAKARSFGVEDRVKFTGQREDVADVLRALDVLCIPSTAHEGIPQIGLQALACGTSVVGSDCGGIPEIIREGESGRIFHAGDAAAMAERIAETVDQRERSAQMCRAGRAQVERQHSLDSMLDRLSEIYLQRLERTAAARSQSAQMASFTGGSLLKLAVKKKV